MTSIACRGCKRLYGNGHDDWCQVREGAPVVVAPPGPPMVQCPRCLGTFPQTDEFFMPRPEAAKFAFHRRCRSCNCKTVAAHRARVKLAKGKADG